LAKAHVYLACGALRRLSNQPGCVGPKVERDASVGAAQRAAAGPDHLPHRDELIEQLWPVIAHPRRDDIAFEHRRRDGATLQLEADLREPIESARLAAKL